MQYLGLVGDMGSTLSGGQRQRANLDDATEEAIVSLIENMRITRLVVAHRPALLRRAHRVLLVKDRQLSEIGPQTRPSLTPAVAGDTPSQVTSVP